MIAPLASHGLIGDGGSLAVAFADRHRIRLGARARGPRQRAQADGPVLPDGFHRVQGDVHGHRHRHARHVLAGAYRRARSERASTCPKRSSLPQLVGGIVFGVGFALAGLCPGTSCVAAATGRGDGFAVVGGHAVGSPAHGSRVRSPTVVLRERRARSLHAARSCSTCRTAWSSAALSRWRWLASG